MIMNESPMNTPASGDSLHLLASLLAMALPQWIPVQTRLPEDKQAVIFVVDGQDWQPHLTGRVLGGSYNAISGSFSVPGLGLCASHWMPAPLAPHDPALAGLNVDPAQAQTMAGLLQRVCAIEALLQQNQHAISAVWRHVPIGSPGQQPLTLNHK